MAPKGAIAGTTGNLGSAVLHELLSAGFDVTVLTRSPESTHNFGRVRVVQVDYDSLDSLTAALSGQDVVANTLGSIPRAIHLCLIDAAIAAKVPRFIPSEFGSDTSNPNAAKLPVYADKVAVQAYLREKVKEYGGGGGGGGGGGFSYTIQINGPLFDWGLKVGFLLDTSSPEVELFDGGSRKFSTTTLASVGKGVCGIIRNLDTTRNQTVYVAEAEVSQRELVGMSGKEIPSVEIDTFGLEREGFFELGKERPDPGIFVFNFLRRTIFGEGVGSLFPVGKLSNELLGVERLSEQEIGGIVKKYCG